MQALFLYNSHEVAATRFFAQLGPLLEDARWLLMADYKGGLEGTTGGSYTRISELLREADAVLYAVGPLSAGDVQVNFEADQLLQAQTEARQKGRELRIIPLLVGGAPATYLPTALRHLTAQMDNTHLGGMSLLEAVYKAVAGLPLPATARVLTTNRLSTEREVRDACLAMIGRARRQGLTLFIGSALFGMGRNVLITRATACRACPPAGK